MSNEAAPAVTVAAFYLFTPLDQPEALVAELESFCSERPLRGTILVAPEGINGTVGGPVDAIDQLLALLRSHPDHPGLAELMDKRSFAERPIGRRMKVRLKREIVTFDMPGFDPAVRSGTYVKAADWNELIEQEDVTLIDTRNDYEIDVGTFQGALNPNTETFRDFIDYARENLDPAKQEKVAMFCTGGIRCEKATAFLIEQGFKEVYHLHGGILKYLEEVPREESKWNGECFVFDERVTVGHDLRPGAYDLCRACRNPICFPDRENPQFEEGVSCKYCHANTSDEQKDRFRERERQVRLARERGEDHIGDKTGDKTGVKTGDKTGDETGEEAEQI